MCSYNSIGGEGGNRATGFCPGHCGRDSGEEQLATLCSSLLPHWCVLHGEPTLCPQEPGDSHWGTEPVPERLPTGRQMATCPDLLFGHQHPYFTGRKENRAEDESHPYSSCFSGFGGGGVCAQSWAQLWGLSSATRLGMQGANWALPLAPQLRQVETVSRDSYPTSLATPQNPRDPLWLGTTFHTSWHNS